MSDQDESSLNISSVTPSTRDEQQKANELVERFEAFAIKHAKPNLDVNQLNEKQIDKVLDIMQQNENNGYNYFCKRLDNAKEIKLAEITSKSAGQRTTRMIVIAIILTVLLLSILILALYKEFFIQWLTFITGNLSGLGIAGATKVFSNDKKTPNVPKEEAASTE